MELHPPTNSYTPYKLAPLQISLRLNTTWDLHGLLGRRAGSDHGGEATLGTLKRRNARFLVLKNGWLDEISFGMAGFSGALIVSFREGTNLQLLLLLLLQDSWFSFNSSIFGMPSSFRWPNVCCFMEMVYQDIILIVSMYGIYFPTFYHKNQQKHR